MSSEISLDRANSTHQKIGFLERVLTSILSKIQELEQKRLFYGVLFGLWFLVSGGFIYVLLDSSSITPTGEITESSYLTWAKVFGSPLTLGAMIALSFVPMSPWLKAVRGVAYFLYLAVLVNLGMQALVSRVVGIFPFDMMGLDAENVGGNWSEAIAVCVTTMILAVPIALLELLLGFLFTRFHQIRDQLTQLYADRDLTESFLNKAKLSNEELKKHNQYTTSLESSGRESFVRHRTTEILKNNVIDLKSRIKPGPNPITSTELEIKRHNREAEELNHQISLAESSMHKAGTVVDLYFHQKG